MRIAVDNPSIILEDDPSRLVHGKDKYFLLKYADVVYVENIERGNFFSEKINEYNLQREIRVVNTIEELNGLADVLVGFRTSKDGTHNIELFNGMKIYDVKDHHMRSRQQYQYLIDAKVDYVIAGGKLDIRSSFFQNAYSSYVGKVLWIPIGYASRYKNIKLFSDRINKAVGLGAINMVNDQMQSDEDMEPVVEHFKGRIWTHETRKYIQDHADELSDCIDALFPTPEVQKDFSYDAVEKLNSYKMFVNDAGNFNFPPPRTYEGMACGCVMVAADNPIYEDLGFEKGISYIDFQESDFDEMAYKIRYYMQHEDELLQIRNKSLDLVKGYTNEMMADRLYGLIKEKYELKTGEYN